MAARDHVIFDLSAAKGQLAKKVASNALVAGISVFELDSSSGELRRHGLKVRLPHQSFQILQLLLQRPGEVVTRDELREVLWGPKTFVGFEVGLNNAIRKLREALDDCAERPLFVETLPRRGYRFIAPVQLLTSAETEATVVPDVAIPAVEQPEPRRGNRPAIRIAALVGTLAIADAAKETAKRIAEESAGVAEKSKAYAEAVKRAEDSPDCPICEVTRDGRPVGVVV